MRSIQTKPGVRAAQRLHFALFSHQVTVLSRRLFDGMSHYATKHDNVRVTHWNSEHLLHRTLPKALRFDGIVVETVARNDYSLLPAGVPAICASSAPWVCPIPRMCDDQAWIGVMAARYFLRRRFTHFAYCGYAYHYGSAERKRGFVSELATAGHTCAEFDFASSEKQDIAFNSRGEQARLRRWIKRLPAATALFTFCDAVAVVAYQCCNEAGREVPDSIAILGVDNDPFLQHALPVPLSSIDLGSAQTGYDCCSALQRWVTEGVAPERDQRVRAARLIPRQTTDHHYVADDLVQRALDLIGDRTLVPLDVATLARRLGSSKRTLERHFQTALGIGAYEMIQRERLEHAQQWLMDTSVSIKDIAGRCGFASSQHFCHAFRRRLSTSPQAWRSQNGLRSAAVVDVFG